MKVKLVELRNNLLGIHDSTHRIAFGFGLGLFLGVFPGTGAIAAVVCSFLLRANKAAALAGALLVNTWINIVAFPAALAIGAFMFRIDPVTITREWSALIRNFTWDAFSNTVWHDTVLSLLLGFTIIGLLLGALGYIITYLTIRHFRLVSQSRTRPPA